MRISYRHIPNVLSSFRLIAAPCLLILALQNQPVAFLIILAVSFLTDALDGFMARRLKVTSKTGARLDSWGDFMTFATVAIGAWWLWPEIFIREAFFVVTGIASFILPVIAGVLKFGRLPSYHTWGAKTMAVVMCIAIYILFTTGIAWPFQCGVILRFFVAAEEIAITLWLKKQRLNVPTFWHLIHSSSHPSCP